MTEAKVKEKRSALKADPKTPIHYWQLLKLEKFGKSGLINSFIDKIKVFGQQNTGILVKRSLSQTTLEQPESSVLRKLQAETKR